MFTVKFVKVLAVSIAESYSALYSVFYFKRNCFVMNKITFLNSRLKKLGLIGFCCLIFLIQHSAYAESSNEKAQRIANESLEAMGGAEAYDNTQYLSWVFFDKRFHVWDKHTGNIRIEYGDNSVVLMNIHDKSGKAWEKGEEITDDTALKAKMEWGYKVWINDSYWLVMPYKLQDPGVNLSYARDDTMANGEDAYVLTMTFNDVGVTPDNKYEVFIDKNTLLVGEFAFYPKVEDTSPRFNRPWTNWQQYGDIMLSDERGKTGMGPIAVYKTLSKAIFESSDKTGLKGALIR